MAGVTMELMPELNPGWVSDQFAHKGARERRWTNGFNFRDI